LAIANIKASVIMPRRRELIKGGLAAIAWPAKAAAASRVRPGDAGWPDDGGWARLNRDTGGRLLKIRSPLSACRKPPDEAACHAVFTALKNPYAIGDDPALTQTTGWVDAWTSSPSAYAVAAETARDVAAAVNFARDNNLRLVVKGGAHSYLGTSNAPDSLLIWTRRMRAIVSHDAFVPEGCAVTPRPAVSIGPGAIWMQAYEAVTTNGGRYVQGGGCLTVGVAGLVLGGGFGSYSKMFGTAAASLLEAEVVTADGSVRIANACTNPDLYWALKGGGGGSFGVVTRLTLRTHDLPEAIGIAHMTIHAASDAAFRRLLGRFVGFYAEALLTPYWGEIVNVRTRNTLDINLEFAGIGRARAEAIWQPFLDWVAGSPDDYSFQRPPLIRDAPARKRWDRAFFAAAAPGAMLLDDRPGAPPENVFWAANLAEAGHFLHGYESAWLRASLLRPDQQDLLADALFAASRIWAIELHFQKGLAGAPPDAISATRETATNPAVLDAFVLAIIAGEGPPAYPGLPGHEPNLINARRDAERIRAAMVELRKVVPDAGSYVAESSFFEAEWQRCYWGENYPRLREIKRKYDPDGLFFAHHGVGSEAWSEDGFTRLEMR
jgi:FAD/FMN-containing dehydrogenase